MSDLKQKIKFWLKAEGKNRDWLAKMTHSKKATVNGWLAAGGKIPPAKQDLILRLMKESKEADLALRNLSAKWKPYALLLTQEEYDLIESAAKMDGMDVRIWCERELVKSARYKEQRSEFRVADDGNDNYRTGPI